MRVLELTTKKGQKFLYDLETGWEIFDNGDKPALWANHREARNLDALETYEEVKSQLVEGKCNKPA